MDKFWQWMEEKDYINHAGEFPTMGIQADCCPKQMIIGYKAEYILELDKNNNNALDMLPWVGNIDNIDKNLDFVIKELNERNQT